MFEEFLSQNGISLERLQSFCTVAESGGIASAFPGNVSRQALISRQIKELEVFFGVELIRRRGKGIELTDAGRELARQVRLQIQGLSDFKAKAVNLPTEFRIASGNSVLEWLLVPTMARIVATTPTSTFQLCDWRTKDIVRGLLDHTVDFGILRESAIIEPLKFYKLGKFGYSLFIPENFGDNCKLRENIPLAISVGTEFLRSFDEATRKVGYSPNVVYRCNSFTQAAQFVKLGLAAAVLPDLAIPSMVGVAPPLAVPWLRGIDRDLGLAWHGRLTEIRSQTDNLRSVLQSTLKTAFPKSQLAKRNRF